MYIFNRYQVAMYSNGIHNSCTLFRRTPRTKCRVHHIRFNLIYLIMYSLIRWTRGIQFNHKLRYSHFIPHRTDSSTYPMYLQRIQYRLTSRFVHLSFKACTTARMPAVLADCHKSVLPCLFSLYLTCTIQVECGTFILSFC